MKKVIVLFADGTEETEALTPVDILRRAGADCTLVSAAGGRRAVGSHGIEVVCDRHIGETADETPDMVIVPGGLPGTTNISASDECRALISRVYEAGGFTAAICAAPSVLGQLGILDGKEAICYPGFESALTGAKISDKKVVRDGNVITAAGMGVALDFALECVSALFGAKKAADLAKSVIR